jgi:hypothetical protein
VDQKSPIFFPMDDYAKANGEEIPTKTLLNSGVKK